MISRKIQWLLILAAVPILAGLLMVSEAGAGQSIQIMPATRAIIPGGSGSATFSIIPITGSKATAGDRKILAGMNKDEKRAGAGNGSSTADRDKGTIGNMSPDSCSSGSC